MDNIIFDYHSLGKKLEVPSEIVQKLEKEARNEFPHDDMLMEIHVLRAIKAYARTAARNTNRAEYAGEPSPARWRSSKTKIYLDTTIISALFDKRTPERMSQTQLFWENISNYDVFISELVIDEINRAPQPLQNKMLEEIRNFTSLTITDDIHYLADMYIRNEIFPEKFLDDALHTAIASANEIGILLSWNFTHLVKIRTRRMVTLINTINNYGPIEIISPPEL